MDVAKTVHQKLREAQGELTQRALARKLGISVGLVARLTTSPENMTLLTLAKISRALHVTPSQLLDNADTHHRKDR
jgi:transcriptional regulator with XRE-family HTH domain